ncbi:hypothetical protein [Micromonospora halophytica]|uniref:Uncharacterized protein n=1 Tax=Micromonospora halophytica TaxID=47864 RepID=A0A1C5IMR3_9ACTN|nr:hypothetical protein [Micromonospora halophytica]SCG59618.1 hypothetical protein GA0070560_11414 [Micromonospora halophytica]
MHTTVLHRAIDLWAARRPPQHLAAVAAAMRAIVSTTNLPGDPAWEHRSRALLADLDAAQHRHGPAHPHTITATLAVAGHLATQPTTPLAAVYYRATVADSALPGEHLATWKTLDMLTVFHALGADHRVQATISTLVHDLVETHGHLHPTATASCLTWAQLAPHDHNATGIAAIALAGLRHIPDPLTRVALTGLARLTGQRPATTTCTPACLEADRVRTGIPNPTHRR